MNIVYTPEQPERRSLVTPGTYLAPLPSGPDVEEVPVLVRYWRIIYRRKWVVLGSIALALALGAIVTILATPRYVSSATLEISRDTDNITGVQGVDQSAAIDQEFYETQYGLLRSRSLARRVAEQLKLDESQEFRALFGLDDGGLLGMDEQGAQVGKSRNDRLNEAEAILLANVRVAPVNASRLVELRFNSPDPVFSAKVANTWASNFMASSLERRFDSASYAREFLETRLEELRKRLETAERKLVAYAGEQEIVNINTSGSTPGEGSKSRSIVESNLDLLNSELARATADRMRAQSRLQEAQANGASTESLTNAAISSLRQRRAEAAAEYARLLADFEPEYPRAVALKSQVDELDRAIRQEENRVGRSFRETYDSAQTRENALQARVGQLKADLLDLRRRSIQYNIYQRDVDTTRTLYEGLLQRYKEIGIAGGVGKSNIAVIDPAKPSSEPFSPNPLLNMLLALVAGTLIGFGIAFGLEQLDEAITDPDDLPKRLGLPLLGVIPRAKGDDPLAELGDRGSAVTEGYVSLRTSLEFSTATGVPKTMVVTSSRAAEGKSTTSVAIAVVLARMGKTVLLVDGDMRSPSVHNILRIPSDQGMSNFLSGHSTLDEIIQPTFAEGLSAVAAGTLPPNAAELLSGGRLGLFMTEAIERFDHVIIDAPPVLGLADAPLLANRADGVMFIIQAGSTKLRMVERSLGRLRATQSALVGGVLTKFETKYAPYSYGDEYKYKYGKEPVPVS